MVYQPPGEGLLPWMWFKNVDRRPVAAGVSVGLSPDYHFNSERLDTLMVERFSSQR